MERVAVTANAVPQIPSSPISQCRVTPIPSRAVLSGFPTPYARDLARTISPAQPLHNPHRTPPIPAAENRIMVQIMIDLIQPDTIIKLPHRLHPRTFPMIFLPKPLPKPAKHPHNPQLILTMRVASARIENHVLHWPGGAGERSATVIAGPEVAVHEDRLDGAVEKRGV